MVLDETGRWAPAPSTGGSPQVTERRQVSQSLHGLSTSLHNPGNARLGDFDPLSQTIEGLNTSMFNPGGTKRFLSFGGLGNKKNTPQAKDMETREFLARRRQEIEELNETYNRLNHDINLLVLSKNSQADDNELEKIQHENEMARMKDELDYQSNVYEQSMRRLKTQHEELLDSREKMIEQNDRSLQEHRQHNAEIASDRDHLIGEVVDLQTKKSQLLGSIRRSVAQQDLSQIPDCSPDPVIRSVRFVSPPDPQYDGTDGGSPDLASRASSTPHASAMQSSGYHPFVNDNASQHVGGGVYNGPAAAVNGGPRLTGNPPKISKRKNPQGSGSSDGARKGAQSSQSGQGKGQTSSQSGDQPSQGVLNPGQVAAGPHPQQIPGVSTSGTSATGGQAPNTGPPSTGGQQQTHVAQTQDGTSLPSSHTGGNHHSGGGGPNFGTTQAEQYPRVIHTDTHGRVLLDGYTGYDGYPGYDGNQQFHQNPHTFRGYDNSGYDGNQDPNWNYQANYGAPRYHNQVGGWIPGNQNIPAPVRHMGPVPPSRNIGNPTLNHSQTSGASFDGVATRPKMTRRSSMSVAMQAVYDNNPGIAALGVDVISRQADSDTVAWSVEQSQRLYRNTVGNAARRQPMLSDPYMAKGPWRDWYADFVENNNCNSWTEQEALPELIRCLKTPAGRMALNRWREIYNGMGSYIQLVECASYVLGPIIGSDPLAEFRSRTQKPGENHRIFGLNLHDLLRKGQPNIALDDPHFIRELFRQFVSGLRSVDDQKVACDAWKNDASLTDLFIAIENSNMKRTLLAGAIPQQRAAAITELPDEDGESDYEIVEFVDDDGTIAAVQFKTGSSKKYWPKHDSRNNQAGKLVPNKDFKGGQKIDSGKALAIMKPKPLIKPQPLTDMIPPELMESLMNQIKNTLTSKREDRPRIDRSKLRCYRCQEMGHYASECTASKPVYRRVDAVEGTEELEN